MIVSARKARTAATARGIIFHGDSTRVMSAKNEAKNFRKELEAKNSEKNVKEEN